MFNDAITKTATVTNTANTGSTSITFDQLTVPGLYQPGDFLKHRVYGVGIPDDTYVSVVFQDGITLGLGTIDDVAVLTTATIPAGTVLSFDPIYQAVTKRTVDESRQFNQLVDVSLTNQIDRDFVMFSSTVIGANVDTSPPIYTSATQLINVANNVNPPLNTPTGNGGGSDITVARTANTVTFKLVGGTANDATNPITDYHVNSFAQIKQAKLRMEFASVATAPTIGTQTQIQSTLGLALFDSRMFTATSGWITLVDSTGTTSGVQTTKQAWVPTGGGFLGATNTAADTPATYVNSATMKTWLGDEATAWEFTGDLTPKTDSVQRLGTGAKRWQNLFVSSTATVDGGLVLNTLAKISTNQTTADIFTSTVNTLRLGPATVVGTQATQNVYNTVATTVNAFGEATAINIGSAAGTATVNSTINTRNVIPNANATYDIGVTGNRYRNIYANNYFGTLNVDQLSGVLTVEQGGTAGNSAQTGLFNLLAGLGSPTPGHVLKTAGLGSYFWAAETGAAVQVGTLINTSRLSAVATAGQTVFTAPTYTIGSGQLRVYVNGVRQSTSDYTETSTTQFTMSPGLVAGDVVLVEVDGYYTFPNVASATVFSPSGNISSTDVQNALQELDNEKVAKAGDTMTGNLTMSGASITLAAGTTSRASIRIPAGSVLSSPISGVIEFDGTNLYVTQSAGPTRKTLVYTDGTVANATNAVTAASANSVAYTNVTGRPPAGYRQVYSGILAYGITASRTYTFDILFEGGITAREFLSPESFVVVTSVNDFYTITTSPTYNSVTTSKQIAMSQTAFNTRFLYTVGVSTYPYPNQINVIIYVLDSTAVSSLTNLGG